MKHTEKILLGKVVDKHKKVYQGIWMALFLPVFPLVIILRILCELGNLAEKIESFLCGKAEKVRTFLFKVIYWKELPTYQEKYGMTREEFLKEND